MMTPNSVFKNFIFNWSSRRDFDCNNIFYFLSLLISCVLTLLSY